MFFIYTSGVPNPSFALDKEIESENFEKWIKDIVKQDFSETSGVSISLNCKHGSNSKKTNCQVAGFYKALP